MTISDEELQNICSGYFDHDNCWCLVESLSKELKKAREIIKTLIDESIHNDEIIAELDIKIARYEKALKQIADGQDESCFVTMRDRAEEALKEQ